MRLHALVDVSRAVSEAGGRLEKIRLLADLLARLGEEEVPLGVAYLSGELPRGKVGVGPATLRDVLPVEPSGEPVLTLEETDATLRRLASFEGPGSTRRRREALRDLFGRATGAEQDFLSRLLLGELRQGAQEGVILEAVAEAAGASASRVRRAVMLRGDAGAVARAALEEGPEALSEFAIRLFRPVKPMLARTAPGVEGALERLGRAALEYKLDGARLQVHRSGDEVRVFTRRLNEKTSVLPEVVEAALSLPVREVVLDGEAVALREDGSPRPFQETMRRFGRAAPAGGSEEAEALRESLPLTPFFFDCLHLDGESLLDLPAAERFRALAEAVPRELRVPRMETDDAEEAEGFLRQALRAGHEGLVAKALDAPYQAGSRGHSWLKLKPSYTADLVILAAEWGHGRRQGWLSNVHLGTLEEPAVGAAARTPSASAATGGGPYPPGLAMVGKTFKGMTDEMLEWQTGRLLELERERRGRVVYVRPELVAEVAFDGVQESPTYPCGLALRFARIRGYREDKGPDEADTLETLREIREGRVPGL